MNVDAQLTPVVSPRPQPFLRNLSIGLLTLLPIVIFWLYWGHLAVNVPKWDDHALKAYLFLSEGEQTLTGKIYQLFRQHNEHRIVLDRIVTWLDFNLFGKLNYFHLMVLGNASLLGLLAIFGAVLKQANRLPSFQKVVPKKRAVLPYLPPIAFLLFNLSSWENAFWGMAALQNFAVVLWAVWAIYGLSFTKNLPGVITLAVLATLTSGNGLLIWPIGAVLLALQRRSRPLIVWGISAAIIIGLYFLGYEKPAGNPPLRGNVLDLFKGFLAFSGAAGEVVPFGNGFTICHLLGLLLITGLGIGLIWSFTRLINLPQSDLSAGEKPTPWQGTARLAFLLSSSRSAAPFSLFIFFLGTLAFLLGTAAIVSWSRVGFGVETLITSRYKIYSLTLLCLAYLFAIIYLLGRKQQLAVLVGLAGSVGICVLSYLTYTDEVLWWRRWLLTNQYNWTYQTNRPVSSIDPTTARWVDNSPAYYDNCLAAIYAAPKAQQIPLDTVYEAGGQFIIKSTASELQTLAQPSFRNPDAGLTLLLQSDKRTYLYGALPSPANNALTVLRRGPYPTRDLLAIFPANEPEPRTYRLAILHTNATSNSCTIHPTNQTLTIKPRAKSDIQKNW